MSTRFLGTVVAVALVTLVGGPAAAAEVRPLPAHTDVDYQLGGAATTPSMKLVTPMKLATKVLAGLR